MRAKRDIQYRVEVQFIYMYIEGERKREDEGRGTKREKEREMEALCDRCSQAQIKEARDKRDECKKPQALSDSDKQ